MSILRKMRTNKAGIDLLKHFEAGTGFEEKAYWDAMGKVWTIGWGFTKDVKEGDRMTEAEGNARLAEEIRDYERTVESACSIPPNENQFAAMVCLSWNIGRLAFQKSEVLKYHNLQRFQQAAASFANWRRSGGKVVNGLIRRRAAEAELYLTECKAAA
jgi:lysozyme